VDFGMDAQEAVTAPRFHHQWLPDQISHEPFAFSSDTMTLLRARGHTLKERDSQGIAAVIRCDAEAGELEAGVDSRGPESSVRVGRERRPGR
jgi:gamma-glutamyltranspeptidase/glutathione hydrolase